MRREVLKRTGIVVLQKGNISSAKSGMDGGDAANGGKPDGYESFKAVDDGSQGGRGWDF